MCHVVAGFGESLNRVSVAVLVVVVVVFLVVVIAFMIVGYDVERVTFIHVALLCENVADEAEKTVSFNSFLGGDSLALVADDLFRQLIEGVGEAEFDRTAMRGFEQLAKLDSALRVLVDYFEEVSALDDVSGKEVVGGACVENAVEFGGRLKG